MKKSKILNDCVSDMKDLPFFVWELAAMVGGMGDSIITSVRMAFDIQISSREDPEGAGKR